MVFAVKIRAIILVVLWRNGLSDEKSRLFELEPHQ